MTKLAFVIAGKTGSSWSELIAKASGSIYSHVELWLDGPQNAARCFSSREPKGASFMVRDLTGPAWEIAALPTSLYHGTPEEDRVIEAFCQGENGKDYDMAGLLGYKLGNGLHDDADVFCSEVVSAILRFCISLTLPRDPWMVSPGDLHAVIKALG